jgi:unsaturated chondroitin disaccharide hydrolase
LRSYRRAFEFAQEQVRACIERYGDFFPMYTTGGKWRHGGELWTDWCGGFLAGMMWLFYSQTRAPFWQGAAEHYSRLLEHRKDDRNVHDLGFIFLNTYARWFQLTGQERRMDTVAAAGVTLSGRFQPRGGYLASFLGPQSLFIDIMMNVPLLFVAADWLERGGDPATAGRLRDLGLQHCRTTERYLVRPDGSAAHEAIFDLTTGSFIRESTQQGLRADSAWSRGLAWSLYGFAQVARWTGQREFLDVACRCADYFVNHLPPGGVPYWDFDLRPESRPLWDSSAAAIAASGLLEIDGVIGSRFAGQAADPVAQSRRQSYTAAARRMLDALCSDEFLAVRTPGWEGILRHGVYHYHKKLGVDESVMWGDHFFVEALTRVLAAVDADRPELAPAAGPRSPQPGGEETR